MSCLIRSWRKNIRYLYIYFRFDYWTNFLSPIRTKLKLHEDFVKQGVVMKVVVVVLVVVVVCAW